jgi:hypothetical protein
MPTKQRVSTSMPNVVANPDAPLAKLQTATEIPTRIHRDMRSASMPKIGAAIMYDRRKAVASEPVLAIAAIISCWAEAAEADLVSGKKWARISGSTAARMYRSM